MSWSAKRVAFLGPEGTFTAEAARQVAPDADRDPRPTIPDVIDTVRSGAADAGVVPLENSIEGSVNLTLDELAFGPPGLYIRSELALSVSMSLIVRKGVALGDVRTVRSQPHALAQCRGWLGANLAGVSVEATTSTAEAARQVAESDGTVAALGTRLSAERLDLEVLASDIQDHPDNMTRFAVIGERMHPRTGADKTSVVVFFGEDRPGLLLRILDEFALRGINLTKIESRPTKQQLGEYCIFIDCAGHLTDARLGEALRSVHRHVAELRVLGSYPRADGMEAAPPATDTDLAYGEAGAWYSRLVAEVDEP